MMHGLTFVRGGIAGLRGILFALCPPRDREVSRFVGTSLEA